MYIYSDFFIVCTLYKHNSPVIYSCLGSGGSIIKWNTTSWTRISSKHITRDSITAFNVSADGKYLAV